MRLKLPQDVADDAFINQGVACHDVLLLSGDDACLVGKGDLGVRDNGGRQERMGMPAPAAGCPADVECKGKTALFKGTVIVTVYG